MMCRFFIVYHYCYF